MTASPHAPVTAACPVGVPKTTLASSYLRSLNPWSDFAVLDVDLASVVASTFGEVDVVLVAVDNFRARLHASRLMHGARKPYVDLGIDSSCWQARVTVCDPSATPSPRASCLVCAWSEASLARAGEDVGYPCAAPEGEDPNPSTLLMGHRGASAAVCEAMALAGTIDLAPSIGCELRDDLASRRMLRFEVPADAAGCAADHALGSPDRTQLEPSPSQLRLGALAKHCGIDGDDLVVLGSRELVVTAVCVSCTSPDFPYRSVGTPLARCQKCGGDQAPVRRARRVRWGEVAERMSGAAATEWFASGDCFAVIGKRGTRVFEFPAAAVEWERGREWLPEDARRFARLPNNYRLDRIRRTRLALIGLGHAGAAVLHQLAPLPWAGILLLDRDRFEPVNSVAHALSSALKIQSPPEVKP